MMSEHRSRHDWDQDGSLSTSVVTAVSQVTGDDPTEIDPLYEVIDPDALDRLVDSLGDDADGQVTFTLNGCAVTVTGDGAIAVSPRA